MLKQQRPTNRPSKQRERFDFKFSNFQALQVPKGWDRLFVSLVSAESGKTIGKSGKAVVKNGSCTWTETISESIYISRYDSSKGCEECLVKLVVSTGSTRSNNTLGEATINMAQHTTSRASAAVSLPLKKCTYGTILQVRVQRATSRSKIGDEGSKNSDNQEKVEEVDHLDVETKSQRSDHSSDSTGKPPREDLATFSRPLTLESEEASESATVIINSFSSLEGSYGRGSLSVENVVKHEEYSSTERRVEGSSGGVLLLPDDYSVDDADSRVYLRQDFHNEAAMSRWSKTNAGSSRNLLEAAEDTIEELRAEAKMWERNARKLMIDLDISKKEFSDLSKKQAELGIELLAVYAEKDGLRRQVEKVKEELQELTLNHATREDPIIQSESFQKVLENEIKYQQELNDDLGQQLKRSQESNIELVCVLQEFEETIEQQRVEIKNLSSLKFNFVDLQNSLATSSEENRILFRQLEQLQESEKKLKADIGLLVEALRDKTDELEKEKESNREILSQVEREYNCKMLTKEEEIASLEAKLSGYVKDEQLNRNAENDVKLLTEIESLRERVRELEKDCTELTDENLDLLFKLKDSNKKDIRKCSSFDSMTSEHPTSCPSDESEVSDPKYQVSNLEEEHKEEQIAGFESSLHFAEILEQMDIAFHLLMKPRYGSSSDKIETNKDHHHALMIADKVDTTEMSVEHIRSLLQELNKLMEARIAESDEILRNHEIEIDDRNGIISEAKKKMEESNLEVQELETSKAKSEENCANLMRELEKKRSEIGHMEAALLSKEHETKFLLQRQQELEAEVSKLQQKTSHLENLQSDLTALSSAFSSYVSANTNLERNIEELETKRHELENTLSGLLVENTRFQECISDLEAQVQQLKDEKRVCLQEMENYKSSATSLQDEVRELRDEMDIQILDLKQKSEDIGKQWLGAQEECVYLKEENKSLQTSAASSALETTELQNLNLELKRENQELHEKCAELVDQMSQMTKSLSDCTRKVESLQGHLTSVQGDFVLRENHLKSDLDALFKENSYQKEKLAEVESSRQMLLEKATEFESLQKEVERLSEQLSDAHNERERISIEVSGLQANNAELQDSLQEVQWEAESTKNKFIAALQDLKDQLAASNQSHDRLMVDHERTLKLLASYRKVEEKLKTDLNDLELKHTISDYERQQLTTEMSMLKVQLQSISKLQDEVSMFKSELKECKLDKGKLELALNTVSGDYEELKAEKISLSGRISVFEGAMSEFEECKRKKLYLEEKLLKMEKDLNASEILCIQNADLKNELTEMKRSNVQFQQKMYILEEEKDECLKKAQALEENLKLMEERNSIHKEGAHNHDFHDEYDRLDINNKNRFLQEISHTPGSQKNYSTVARERYERTKSSLETELRDLRERYLEMSLKYAEVEGQREDLVMKLKATRSGKRWFA
ncbi:hypothetical protein C2S51_030876 [Perilla frutescens var. frutescens]|nr:hypothetical protein C2S51_030876 [Perilla frutescens var. frutescens]